MSNISEHVNVFVVTRKDERLTTIMGVLTYSEFKLLEKMAISVPSEREAQVAQNTPIGKVLQKVYSYSMSNNNVQENSSKLCTSFRHASIIETGANQGYMIVWYLTEYLRKK